MKRSASMPRSLRRAPPMEISSSVPSLHLMGARPWSSIPRWGPDGLNQWCQVLGWDFGEKGSKGGMGANLNGPSCGIAVRESSSPLPSFWFRVDSMAAALAELKAAGGSAEEVFEAPPHGTMCCVKDDQGVAFGHSAELRSSPKFLTETQNLLATAKEA